MYLIQFVRVPMALSLLALMVGGDQEMSVHHENTTRQIHCKYNLNTCLEKMPPILQEAELTGIPSSKAEVDASCSAFKTGMGCIEEYANQCLSPRDHKVLEDHVAGAKHTFRFLCDDPGFQKDYLRYTTCYRGISVDWDACANRFVQLVREEMIRKNVSEQSRLLELCCAKHGFLKCVYTASRLKCRQEEALFLNKIAETLSNMRVYSPMCTHIETQLCGSSHGSCSGPLILAAILVLALYRLRT